MPSPMSDIRITCDDERAHYHTRFEEMKAWIDKRAEPRSLERKGPWVIGRSTANTIKAEG